MAKAICGIYKITNQVNGKVYIGRSNDIKKRWREHKTELNNNKKDYNEYFQRSWNKYGKDNFTFEILEECNADIIDVREQYYIDIHDSTNIAKGYNLRGADGINSFTEEQILAMSCENHFRAKLNADIVKRIQYIKLKYDKYNIRGTYAAMAIHFNMDLNLVKQWNDRNWISIKLTEQDIEYFDNTFDLSFMEEYKYNRSLFSLRQYREIKGLNLQHISQDIIASLYNATIKQVKEIIESPSSIKLEPIMPTQELLESLKK